jgi:hypothetical protein
MGSERPRGLRLHFRDRSFRKRPRRLHRNPDRKDERLPGGSLHSPASTLDPPAENTAACSHALSRESAFPQSDESRAADAAAQSEPARSVLEIIP